MKQFISKTIVFMFVLTIIFTSIPVTKVQAALKPVISSSQVKIKKNACSVKKGKKIKLTAKYSKKDITKTGTWKSSKKSVATISKSGVLTTKKAGTTYVTVKYKGKSSQKLKVVVKADTKPAPEPNDTSGKGFTITYNKNSKNTSDKLNGSVTQKIVTASDEILKFSTTVTPANGKKFLGWYDAPTGGNRIYETYKPTGDITLYAHYTDENTQQVTFSLGCNYGGTYSFMDTDPIIHAKEYDSITNTYNRGPMVFDDKNNIKWDHNYVVEDKAAFIIDSLPVPSVPGYTFAGWYTTDQTFYSTINKGVKVENGQEIDVSVTRLYARFTKKLTISFDDMRGGKYDDIVINSYETFADAGKKLPQPSVPGATFVGWAMDIDNHEYYWQSSKPLVTEDQYFFNCFEWYGFMCSGCEAVSKDRHGGLSGCKPGCDTGFGAVNDDRLIYEETDHVTLYPVYKQYNLRLSFDPKGGYFPYNDPGNIHLTFDSAVDDPFDNHHDIGYYSNLLGSEPYGWLPKPGHEDDVKGVWHYGNSIKTMPKVIRNNYIFDKWILPDGTELTYDTILTENMTVSAKWIPGNCYVMFDPTDGTLTQEERDRVGLDGAWRYKVTTESSVSGSGKQFPVPVSYEGRKFEGWYTKDGEEVTKDTQITGDIIVFARWGSKANSKPETQKPSTDKDTSANKDTNSNDKNEIVHATDITVTDMDWQPVDKNNNHYTIVYGGKGNQTGLGFTATVLPSTLKDTARNVIWTSSNPNIISVTAGKEVIYSPNWFDYFEFGTDVGDVVLTVTSMDNPSVSFNINVTVIKK